MRDGVLSDVPVLGDDEGDRLADVADLVLASAVLGAAVGERRSRDHSGSGSAIRGASGPARSSGVDGVTSRRRKHGGDV